MTGNNNIPAPERSKGEMGVMVKPLEWVDGERGFPTDANTIIGRYRVWDFDGEDSHYMRPEDRAGLYVGGNLDHAKAAAQADYEQRILSTLETPPLHKEGEAVATLHVRTIGDFRSLDLELVEAGIKANIENMPDGSYPLYAAPVPVPQQLMEYEGEGEPYAEFISADEPTVTRAGYAGELLLSLDRSRVVGIRVFTTPQPSTSPAPVPVTITPHMVERGLVHYSEGGCSGLSESERREVVEAILWAAISPGETS